MNHIRQFLAWAAAKDIRLCSEEPGYEFNEFQPVGDAAVISLIDEFLTKTDDSGIDVGDTTSGKVHVSVFHGGQRTSILIDPDHATRVAERLWDCAATGRAVQMENQPQESIP